MDRIARGSGGSLVGSGARVPPSPSLLAPLQRSRGGRGGAGPCGGARGARSWDIPGLKVSLFPESRVHPFGSLSLALNQTDAAANRVSIGFMAAAGIDITLFRYFFVTAEARYAAVPGNCCALPRVTGLV